MPKFTKATRVAWHCAYLAEEELLESWQGRQHRQEWRGPECDQQEEVEDDDIGDDRWYEMECDDQPEEVLDFFDEPRNDLEDDDVQLDDASSEYSDHADCQSQYTEC